jgi:hypothetical protein
MHACHCYDVDVVLKDISKVPPFRFWPSSQRKNSIVPKSAQQSKKKPLAFSILKTTRTSGSKHQTSNININMEDGHPLDSRLQDTTSCNASIEEGVTPKEQKAEKNKRGPVSLIKAATRIITFPGLSRRSKATVATAAATEQTPLVVSKALTQRQSGISSINTSGNASGDPLLIVTSTSEDSRVPVPQGDSNSRSKHGTWGVLAHQVRNGEFFLRTGGPSWDENCNQGGNDDHAHCSSSKHEKRQQAQDEIRSLVEFSLLQCLLAIFAYIAIAVLAFSVVFDHWTVIDSAYFAVVTFCTVGFGDLVPDTYAGRVFTCFFALSGVACLGIALGVVGNNIIEAEHIAVKQAGEISKYRMVTLLSSAKTPDTDSSSHPTGEEFCESLGVPQPPPVVQVVQRKPLHIIGELSLVVVILLLFATVISDDPGVDDGIWDIGTGLYFAISKYRCAFVDRPPVDDACRNGLILTCPCLLL